MTGYGGGYAAAPQRVDITEIVTESGTSFSVDDSNNGQSIYADNAGTITVTVDQGAVGTSCRITQDGAGQVQLTAGSGVTLKHPSTFNPYTAEQNSLLFLEWKDATTVYVSGDMEAA